YTNETRLFVPHNITDVVVLVNFITGHLLVWLLIVYIVRRVRRKYSEANQFYYRFLISSSLCLFIFFSINIATVGIAYYLKPAENLELNGRNVSQYFAKVVLGIWMIAGMYEAIYQQFLLKETQKQKNELLRLQMQQQLDNLKGKVNPHFLFNSLNTLSSLIYSDSAKAEQFVEELSAVYRYMLKNNEDDLATLKEEIDFINSFFILIKIRFTDGIQTSINVEERLEKNKLPAISLQILVENAIKHNVISKAEPLHISISTEGETLVVSNNLQKKPQTLASEKMGLNYIISKYALVNKSGVEIDDAGDHFTVRLPLLKPMETFDRRYSAAKISTGSYD
ncbi:MAG TPA: histidine kinase, partial [Flavisolibacter sp.]|nr:histidine kinase [Flavisolibacter sp.]